MTDCTNRKEIENILWSVFASFSYRDIETPAFFGGQPRKSIADSIAKIYENEKVVTPIRYSCAGTVYKDGEEKSEYVISLAGGKNASAFAEPIAASVEGLIALGIEDFYIKIGSNTFVNALAESVSGGKELVQKIAQKDKDGIKNILDSVKADEKIKTLILNLPNILGDTCILDTLDEIKLPEKADRSIALLTDVFKLLVLYGFEKFPIIDLSLTGDDKYDDMCFEIYLNNLKAPIATGGIRECMCGKKPIKVTEAIFDTEKIASLKQGGENSGNFSRTLIFAENNANGIAYDIAYNLRVNGCMVEGYISGGNFSDAEKYAKNTNVDCIIRAFADGKMMIKDFKRDEITETTVNDFLEYYDDGDEEDDCDCGCGEHHHHGEDCDCGCHNDNKHTH